MVKIAVNGALGRMGGRVVALAEASKDFEITGKFDASGPSRLPETALKMHGKGVLIDFSSPAGSREAALVAQQNGWALVMGTTGLDAEDQRVLETASKKVAVVVSSNMSIGVNVMLALLELACKKLPKGFIIEMSESHHVHKKDAPSGTALMLAKRIAEARPMDLTVLSRSIRSIREGEVVGDHTVLFDGPEETLELRHHAKSRDIFAQGALLAAKFAASAKPGLYSMADILK